MKPSDPSHFPSRLTSQSGLTMAELIISMVLGMLIVLSASSLLISSKASYLMHDDAAVIQETGRHVIEILRRSLHQVDYENWGRQEINPAVNQALIASIAGMDANSIKSTTVGMTNPVNKSVNGSDILGVRSFGAGQGDHGDGTILNCAGFGIPESSQSAAEMDHGWSLFYVAEDNSGEPELRCKYKGKTTWSSVAIARGVEAFQVLYGLESETPGAAIRYMSATSINTLDQSLMLVGADDQARALDKQRKTYWKKVVAIKVAFMVRGIARVRKGELERRYDLLGKDYSELHARMDPGVLIQEQSFSASNRNRLRKIFSVNIQLRNRTLGDTA